MHTVFLHTNQDLLPLLSRAFERQDALDWGITKDSKLDMIVHEAINEDDLSSNACDTNLVDEYTHTHASNGQQRIGRAKGVSHKKMGSRARRRQKRHEKAANAYAPILKLTSKRVLKHPIPTPISLKGMPIANGAYVGKRVEDVDKVQDLQTLLDKGFHLVEWDGRSPQTLLDKNGRVIGVLAGQPRDDDWELTISQACAAMENAREHCTLKLSDTHHRRGLYSCLAAGVSYGGGQQQPGNLQNLKANQDQLRALLSEPAIQRLAGFGSSILCHYAPKIYKVYANTKTSLKSMHPHLAWNFHNSVFAATTFNLGPATVTFDHTDNANFASGMCSITALGDFNPTTSGHLVLFDLGLIIQFPPGATILIPSAILRHGNISISPLEKRLSLTQYFAGGLIRWVEYGFRTENTFKQQSPEAWDAAQLQRQTRVQEAAEYFSIYKELEKDCSEYTP